MIEKFSKADVVVYKLIKLELINYNKTNIRIRRIYNNYICGLKEHLSDF